MQTAITCTSKHADTLSVRKYCWHCRNETAPTSCTTSSTMINDVCDEHQAVTHVYSSPVRRLSSGAISSRGRETINQWHITTHLAHCACPGLESICLPVILIALDAIITASVSQMLHRAHYGAYGVPGCTMNASMADIPSIREGFKWHQQLWRQTQELGGIGPAVAPGL